MDDQLSSGTEWVSTAIRAAVEAGAAILDVYGTAFTVELKEDRSPLTDADRRSTEVIERRLAGTGVPILSEEGKHTAYEQRRTWEWLWLVDPLDGTREFVKRNGEFTVNIALIRTGSVVGGVVYVPVTGTLYVALEGRGAYRTARAPAAAAGNESWERATTDGQRLPCTPKRTAFTVVASRSHLSPETTDYIETLRKERGDIEVISRGSSLKICAVAEGSADVYPRFAPTMEWDTAAGHAIVKEAGGNVCHVDGLRELVYNKPDLTNPWFVVTHGERQDASATGG